MQKNSSYPDISKRLLKWYRKEKRDLPWRRTRDPYAIWVSEIMLQQTQVKTVLPYYERWLKAFPTVDKLAAAREDKVLKLWEGLGYYSRARNLRRAAEIVALELNGNVPDSMAEILKLPGVGRYTAGAVLSIAFGKKVPVLDGNVKRVLSRLFCLKENGKDSRSEKRLWAVAESLLPAKSVGDFNQALMELGASLCIPNKPLCLSCPLNNMCEAKITNRQDRFPPPKPSVPAKKIEVSAAVIIKNKKVYIQRRPLNGLMGGLWEFPGGKREGNETMEECLLREIREELDVDVEIVEKLTIIKHSYTQFRVTLHVYRCRLPRGRIRAQSCEEWKWAEPETLDSFAFPAANSKIVAGLSNGGFHRKPARSNKND